MTDRELLELWARGLRQMALQAAVDPQRVFELAETLEPMLLDLQEPDAEERIQERLDQFAARYPDGADYLRRG